ncbi:MAG: helix-turn-helix domain-containing protein [Bauldia sp.]
MAITRMTLDQIRKRKPRVDRAKIEATTDADIERQIAEDPDTAPDVTVSGPPLVRRIPQIDALRIRTIREKTGLTQAMLAGALRIPVSTYRNWEQGRTRPDPVARSLLFLVERDPKRVLALLAAAE